MFFRTEFDLFLYLTPIAMRKRTNAQLTRSMTCGSTRQWTFRLCLSLSLSLSLCLSVSLSLFCPSIHLSYSDIRFQLCSYCLLLDSSERKKLNHSMYKEESIHEYTKCPIVLTATFCTINQWTVYKLQTFIPASSHHWTCLTVFYVNRKAWKKVSAFVKKK